MEPVAKIEDRLEMAAKYLALQTRAGRKSAEIDVDAWSRLIGDARTELVARLVKQQAA